MKIFLIGSIAFDEICSFQGRFADILDRNNLDNLSVCFTVENRQRFFGGCAGNIAYNLGLLNVSANICSFVGTDGEEYLEVLESWGMNIDFVKMLNGNTAMAFITTDQYQNQIANFAPGVIGRGAPDFELPETAEKDDIILISPEEHDRMISAADMASEKGMKVMFDPGQMIHTFSRDELLHILHHVYALFLNDYEWRLMLKITQLSMDEIVRNVDLIVVTHGKNGADYIDHGDLHPVKAINVEKVEDPTGAGDSFRAGFIAGLSKSLDLATCAKIGTLLGAECVKSKQTQGHKLSENLKHELEKLGFV